MAELFTVESFRQMAYLARIAIQSCDQNNSMTIAEKAECAKLLSIRDIVYKWDRDQRPGEVSDPRVDAVSYLNASMLTDEFQANVKYILANIKGLQQMAVVVKNIAQVLDTIVAVFKILAI